MRTLRCLLVVVMTAALWWSGASAAQAGRASAPVLHRPAVTAGTVVLKGKARPGAVVTVQVRAKRWSKLRKVRANSRGRYRVVVPAPKAKRSYRVVSKGRASAVRQVKPPVTESPAPPAVPAVPTPTPEPPVVEPEPPVAEPEPPVAEPEPPVAEPEPAPADACGTRPQRPDGSHYECTFVDDFDGTSLDLSKWLVQETAFSGMVGGDVGGVYGCYVNNDRTVRVADGTVRLSSTVRDEPFLCKSPFGNFMTRGEVSTIVTSTKFSQTYGRFEARLKMPAESGTPGSHSAFWLYPQKTTYGKWPGSGEVDIAEWFSARPDNVYPSVHYAGENVLQSTGFTCPMPTSSTEFHTYAVEWTPTVMRFYYDGQHCFSHSWTPTGLTAPQPFDQPFYVVLTQVWGGQWNTRTAAMPDTSTLVVDWVKAWE